MEKPRVVDISGRAVNGSHRGHGSQFTRKMEHAVAALMTHRTLEEAAKSGGTSVSTLKRWKATPEFRSAHLAARQESFSELCPRLQQQCDGLGAVLLKAMATANPSSVRARAAVAIVRMGLRALTLETLGQRVAALERTQPERDPAPPTPRDEARYLSGSSTANIGQW